MSHCSLTLTPSWKENTVESIAIAIEFDSLEKQEGEELCASQLKTVSIPGCRFEGFTVTDAHGAVGYTVRESKPYPYEYVHYDIERALFGNVRLEYTVYPREYEEGQQCGPYFDLKAEEGGANTAGISILPRFEGYTGDIDVSYDLSKMPDGSSGANTFGEGDFTYHGQFEDIRQSYYAIGRIHSITEGDFGFYWLAKPDFDVKPIAEFTKDLFAVMAKKFRDTSSLYRIFVRHDPYKSSGGTALIRSYMFGWNDCNKVSVESMQNILAHEMVHNWPHLNDDPYGTCTWYAEGTAEFYSVMIPFRAGLADERMTLNEIQRRTDAYCTNPTRALSDMESVKICWQDRRAQKLPYGRGFIFIANTDAMIRKATNGRVSFDDVALDILEYGKTHDIKELTNDLFIDTVKRLSGLDVRREWEAMHAGGDIAPIEGVFDGKFRFAEQPAVEADTGKSVTGYLWSIA